MQGLNLKGLSDVCVLIMALGVSRPIDGKQTGFPTRSPRFDRQHLAAATNLFKEKQLIELF
jgi:hypothetical protein